jgi:BirA family biotin operon repressor/biotin-[acetyl-CoA-carboxylase] ligase
MNERDLLLQLMAGPATGQALSCASGQTRAAVWKRIAALRGAGVDIIAQAGRGYALSRPIELLDAGAIRAHLRSSLRSSVSTLEIDWSLDSTNSELLRRVTPAEGVAVLLAERQTGGRGRRGRTWASPLASNIYLSLARIFSGGLARLPGLSLVAGVATAEALHALGYTDVRLKWPNDVVVVDENGMRKLGGLLIEGGGEHAGPVRAVLGLGLNVRMPPAFAETITQPWTDLSSLANVDGRVPSRNEIVATLLAHWIPALTQFDADGLPPFLPRYATLDVLAGCDVTLHAGADGPARTAHALGLAEDGALRVRIDGREVRVHSAEVSARATSVHTA